MAARKRREAEHNKSEGTYRGLLQQPWSWSIVTWDTFTGQGIANATGDEGVMVCSSLGTGQGIAVLVLLQRFWATALEDPVPGPGI